MQHACYAIYELLQIVRASVAAHPAHARALATACACWHAALALTSHLAATRLCQCRSNHAPLRRAARPAARRTAAPDSEGCGSRARSEHCFSNVKLASKPFKHVSGRSLHVSNLKGGVLRRRLC